MRSAAGETLGALAMFVEAEVAKAADGFVIAMAVEYLAEAVITGVFTGAAAAGRGGVCRGRSSKGGKWLRESNVAGTLAELVVAGALVEVGMVRVEAGTVKTADGVVKAAGVGTLVQLVMAGALVEAGVVCVEAGAANTAGGVVKAAAVFVKTVAVKATGGLVCQIRCCRAVEHRIKMQHACRYVVSDYQSPKKGISMLFSAQPLHLPLSIDKR
eukprot:1159686-Pelagomonas_calceolata.AAC.3